MEVLKRQKIGFEELAARHMLARCGGSGFGGSVAHVLLAGAWTWMARG
jgi:hypothetical protein